MRELERIEKENEELLRKIEENKALIERINSTDPLHQAAIDLHATLCNFEHVERCGWEYEIVRGIHNWNSPTHAMWLAKAQKLADEGIDLDYALKINKIMRGL